MQNVRIKICGITSIYDARMVCSFPIHAIGLNFVKRSKRRIGFRTAKEILDKLPPFVEPILIFENEKISEIIYLCVSLGINTVQLHGTEPVSCCNDLKRFNKRLKIIKAFPAKEASIYELNAYKRHCDCFLLDSTNNKNQMGGTGKLSNLGSAQDIVSKSKLPVILAGGLTPDNVNNATRRVKPYGIDINSGVESSIGKKDRDLMERLFKELNL